MMISRSFTFALAFNNILTIFQNPFMEARYNGVIGDVLVLFTSTLRLSNIPTISSNPFVQARCKRILPKHDINSLGFFF